MPLADVRVRTDPTTPTLNTDPRLGRAERAVAAAGARLAEERAARLPRLDVSGGLQDFGTLDSGHVVEWLAGVRVTWPLFTGGVRSAQVRRAEAGVAAAQAERDATELALGDELDAAQTAYLEADARAEALAVAVTQWREVARIAALALDAGSGVQRDLLEAQAGLFEATAGAARARYEAVLARARAARAEGSLDTNWIESVLEEGR
jgi:outer membrane protein TolC